MHEILLSFVGNRDPYAGGAGTDGAEPGPVLSLLEAREFSRVVLFCTGSEYVERARSVEEIVRADGDGTKFNFVSVELESPIDYEEIFRELHRAIDQFMPTIAHLPHRLSILLDPGTPQMQTAWFLLVAGGCLDAALLQGVPARFAGGAYKVRTVDMHEGMFPGLRISRAEGTPAAVTQARAASAGDTPAAPVEGARDVDTWIRSSAPDVVGESPVFRSALEQALQVAQYDVSVVVHGETGTGKEIIAQLIHNASPRAGKPFVAVNCAAVATNLAESELFGHEKGAFTGAERARLGQFRAADGGTVFLDEVGDLAMETQAKLLRVLEDRTLTPVGGDNTVSVDIRVIAATNKDLEAMVAKGTFRRDLYERLAHVTLALPPLRERQEDIPLLLRHFVDRWNATYHEEKGLAEETVAYLVEYPWPGNVRELRNAVEATCAMGRSAAIGPELLPPGVQRYFNRERTNASISTEIPADGLDLKALMNNLEKSYYEEALKRTEGNAEQAARLLGLNGAAFRKAARERLDVRYREGE
jgi:DNA-binding NtrC family response regulator